MRNKLKTANILAILLSCIFTLCFFANMFASEVYGESTGETEETEEIDEGTDNGTGTDEGTSTPESEFEVPPKFVTAVAAWKYAETKLYELAHWESLVRNHEIRPNLSVAGQTIRTVKVFNGPQDCYGTFSTLMLPGKVFGVESYTHLENKGGVITKRVTSQQTAEREPIWGNETVIVMTEAEYCAVNGTLPFMPGYIISTSTTMNGTSRPINDGTKISFSLELKNGALPNYLMQLKEASGATTMPIIEDGGLRLDVVLNAKTGYFYSISTTELYNITVLGVNVNVNSTRTEVYSKFIK